MSTDAVGGVWTYACELRAELEAAGIEVVLATLGPSPPPEAGPYLRCRLEWQEDPWDDVHDSGAWLLDLARAERADVVHLNGYAHGALAWDVPAVVVAHSCVLSWHAAVRGVPAGAAWERYRRAVGAGLRAAHAVVAPTAAMREALRRHYGPRGSCRVIANGVSPHPAGDDQRPTALLDGAAASRRIDDGRLAFVLAAGRLWDAAKGLDTLDAAAGRCAWPVVVAGDGRGATGRNVELLGQLDRAALRACMGRAAIFAHPARYEPFGLAVLEAATAGCALVLGDIPSLREQWDGAALFAAPGDHDALARALQRLTGDAQLRGTLALRARRRARRGSARAMARAYADLYARGARAVAA